MEPLARASDLSISGAECVTALCTAGFRVLRRSPGRTELARGSRVLVVPDALVLPPSTLDHILTVADLSAERLSSLARDVGTDTHIACSAFEAFEAGDDRNA